MKESKKAGESYTEMSQLVLPNDTNLLGNLLGGQLMHWIDIVGAMVASRHSNQKVATVSMDGLDFRHPIRQGIGFTKGHPDLGGKYLDAGCSRGICREYVKREADADQCG